LVPASTSVTAVPTFVKLTQPPRMAVISTLPVTGPIPKMAVQQQIPSIRFPVPQPISVCTGMHAPLLTAMPRLSCALTSATVPLPEIQTHTLQPIICADNTRIATASTAVVHTHTSTVPYCTNVTQQVHTVANVANANVMQMTDNVPMVLPQPVSTGTLGLPIC